MKKQLFALLGLGLLLATASAYAQTVALKANVPFNFIVARQTLPAGEYMIQTLGGSGQVLLIRGSNQNANSLVLANWCESLKASAKSKLVFNQYGDRYFLSQIWVAGHKSGRDIPKSRLEAEVAQDYTSRSVIVLADLR